MSDEEKVAYSASKESSLSPSEMEDQKAARKAILERVSDTQTSEKLMDNALHEAQMNLSESAYASLQESQQIWLRQGRGKAINDLVRQGVPSGDAFARANSERADWISVRTMWAMLIESPGKFGGFYRSVADRTLEIYEMENEQLNLVVRAAKDDFVFTATGSIQDNSAQLRSENDPNAAIRLKASESGDTIEISLEPSFGASHAARYGMLVEGQYQRVTPGELNVFAL